MSERSPCHPKLLAKPRECPWRWPQHVRGVAVRVGSGIVTRRLFTLASAAALLLCVATVALWAVSFYCLPVVTFYTPDHEIRFQSFRGEMELDFLGSHPNKTRGIKFRTADPRQAALSKLAASDPSYRFDWNLHLPHVFLIRTWHDIPHIEADYYFVLSDWVLVLMFGIPASFLWARYRSRGNRSRAGLCLSCGYDLTGNTSGTCPECGMPVPSSTATPQPKAPGLRDTGQGLSCFQRLCIVGAYIRPFGLWPMAWARYRSSSSCIISSRFRCTTFSVSTARALD